MSKPYLANPTKRGGPTLEAPIQTSTRVAGQETSSSLLFRPLPSLMDKTPPTVGRETAFGGAAARSNLYSDPNQNSSDDDMPICGSLFRAIGADSSPMSKSAAAMSSESQDFLRKQQRQYALWVTGKHSAVPALRDLLLAANATYGDVKLHESPWTNHRCKLTPDEKNHYKTTKLRTELFGDLSYGEFFRTAKNLCVLCVFILLLLLYKSLTHNRYDIAKKHKPSAQVAQNFK
jgi:hypothetical protein